VKGHTIHIRYDADNDINHASSLEIYLNYTDILTTLKAEILRSPANRDDPNEHLLARFYRNGAPVYVDIKVCCAGSLYEMNIVEEKEFQPSIVTPPSR
jgi:hypothetical protein